VAILNTSVTAKDGTFLGLLVYELAKTDLCRT